MAAVTFVGLIEINDGTSRSIGLPAGSLAGDLAIVTMNANADATATSVSNLDSQVLVNNQSSIYQACRVGHRRLASGTETFPYTTNSNNYNCTVAVYRNVETAAGGVTRTSGAGVQNVSASTQAMGYPNPPAIAGPGGATVAVGAAALGDGTANPGWAVPAGYNNRLTRNHDISLGKNCAHAIFDKLSTTDEPVPAPDSYTNNVAVNFASVGFIYTLRATNEAPNAPTGLAPTGATGATAVTLSAVVSDPNGGNVQASFEVSTASNFSSISTYLGSTVASGGTSTFALSGLVADTTYYLRARATDPEGASSGYATAVSFLSNRSPATPTAVSGSATGNSGSLTATVTDPDSGNVYAEFQASTDSGFASIYGTYLGSTVASGQASVIAGVTLPPNTTIYVRARSIDPGGLVSAFSAGSSFVTGNAATPLVGTSTAATATGSGPGRRIDRCQDGTLWAFANDAAASVTPRYSKDSGATWTSATALPGLTNCSVFIDLDDFCHVVWQQNGSTGPNGVALTANNLYYMRGTPNAGRTAWAWSAAIAIGGVSGGGNGGDDQPDVIAHREGTGWKAHAVFSNNNASNGDAVRYARVNITSGQVITKDVNEILGGAYGNGNHKSASLDFNHTGDGKTVAGGTPHLYVGWTAGALGAGKGVRFRKAVYATGAWTWNAEREIDPNNRVLGVDHWLTCHFDGTRVSLTGMLVDGPGAYSLIIYDRDAADTTTTTHAVASGVHAGAAAQIEHLAGGSSGYDSAGNIYLFGRDLSGANGTRKVNYRKWTWATTTKGPIVTFETTGNNAPYMSASRGPGVGVIYTDGTASPYNVNYYEVVRLVTGNYVPAIML